MHKNIKLFGIGDNDLLRRVESYLESKHVSCFRDLKVEVREGVVTISGKVDSLHQRQVAVNSCRRVAGVRHLVDDIYIDSNEPIIVN